MTVLTWLLRLLLGLVLLVVLAIGGVLLIEPEIDLSPYRERLAARASELTGREIRLDGDIRVDLGRHSRVALTDLRIANPDWAATPSLLRVGEAAAGIDLGALLSGVVHIEGVRLRDTTAALEVSADGDDNWTFATADKPPTPKTTDREGRKLALVVDDVLVENVAVVYRDPAAAEPVDLHIDRLQQRNEDGLLRLDATGRLQQLPLRIDGHVGPLAGVLAARDVDVDLRGTLGETLLTLQGQLGEPARLEDIELQSTLRSPSLVPLLAAFGIDHPEASDADLTLTVTDLEPGFAWQATGRLGPVNVDAYGKIGRPLALQDGELQFDLNGADLAALGKLTGIPALPAQAYRLAGKAQRGERGLVLHDLSLETGDSRATLNGELPLFPSVADARSRLQVEIPHPELYAALLGPASQGLGPISIDASLAPQDGGDRLVDASAALGDNRLALKGSLGSRPDLHGTDLAFEAAGPDIGALAAATGADGLPAEPYRLAGRLAVDADGQLQLETTEGKLGDLTVAASGSLGRLADRTGADLAVSARGGSLNATVGAITGADLPDLPFEIQTRITGDLAAPAIGNLAARLGDATLSAPGRLGPPPTFAGTDTGVELSVPQIEKLLTDLPEQAPRLRGAYHGTARLRENGQRLEISDARIRGDDLDLRLNAALPVSGELAGTRLRWQVSGPDLAALLPASAQYRPPASPFETRADLAFDPTHVRIEQYEVKLGDAAIQGKGRVSLDPSRPDSDLAMQAAGPRMTDLGELQGVRLPPDPFELELQFSQAAQGYAVRDLLFRAGDGEMRGSVAYQPGEPPRVDVDATLRNLDLRRFLPEEPAPDAEPAAKPPAEADRPARVIPDTEPPLDLLDALNADIRLRGEGLSYADPVFTEKTLMRDLELRARLEGGNLALERMLASGDRGRFDIKGHIDRDGRDAQVAWSLQATDFRFGLLAQGKGLDELPAHDLDVELTTGGRTYRQLAGALNGKIEMAGGKGQTANAGLERALGDFFGQLLDAVNPFARKEERTTIECTAASIDIRDGVVLINPGFVIRTDKIDITANGRVDLNSEKIDVRFSNSPRKGLGISLVGVVNPYVKVGGTLASPGITLHAPRAVVEGSAAVATGGLSIIARQLYERATGAMQDSCQKVLEAAANPLGSSAADERPDAAADEAPTGFHGIPQSD